MIDAVALLLIAVALIVATWPVISMRRRNREVAERQRVDQEFREKELRFRAAMDATADGIFLIDRATMRYVDVNAAASRMSGFERGELLELAPEALTSANRADLERTYDAVIEGTQPAAPVELQIRRKDNIHVPVEIQRYAVRIGQNWTVVAVARDIDARLRRQRAVETNAMQQGLIAAFGQQALADTDFDSLINRAAAVAGEGLTVDFCKLLELAPDGTSLTNKAGFGWGKEWIGRTIVEASTQSLNRFVLDAGEPVVVADFDKEIRFERTQTLRVHGIRSGVQVRIDGVDGAFGILGAYSQNSREFSAESVDFLQSVANIVTAAILRRHSEEKPAHLAHFDSTTGLPTKALDSRSTQRMALVLDLRSAIDREQLELHYQPQVSLGTGEVIGVEALLRWRHPQHGWVPPAEFIPLAEEAGLIVSIGDWVLRTACAQAAEWCNAGRRLVVAVNVSPLQLRRGDFVASVRAALESSCLDARFLELELTESVIMESAESSIASLAELSAMGVSIAIDDFGTGYSSLSYLKRLPIDTIKIDRAFIRDIIADSDDAAIVRAVIDMSHHMKLKVVAEGVETEEQANFLRRTKCDVVQGYLFSKPVPAPALIEFLDSARANPLLTATSDSKPSLLLVDDEENILQSLQRVFQREGYCIHTAKSAREAYEVLANGPIGVIVSDHRMSDVSGTEFLTRVKGLYPDTIRIILSGYGDLATVTSAINDGAAYKFLSKPWNDEALRRDIGQAFRVYADRRVAA